MMSWFKKHLNWTYIILVVGVNAVLSIILVPILLGLDENSISFMLLAGAYSILYSFVVPMTIGGGIIVQKGRSLGYLLWFLVGIGPIVVLCLENRADSRLAQEET